MSSPTSDCNRFHERPGKKKPPLILSLGSDFEMKRKQDEKDETPRYLKWKKARSTPVVLGEWINVNALNDLCTNCFLVSDFRESKWYLVKWDLFSDSEKDWIMDIGFIAKHTEEMYKKFWSLLERQLPIDDSFRARFKSLYLVMFAR